MLHRLPQEPKAVIQAGSSGSRFAPLILILLLAAPVATFAYAGTFSRYMADDYCTASSLQSVGLLKSQIDSYTQWSGRFAFTLSVSLAEAVGPSLARLLPAFAVLGLTASLVLAVTSGVRWVGTRLPERYVICIALLITFLTLRGPRTSINHFIGKPAC